MGEGEADVGVIPAAPGWLFSFVADLSSRRRASWVAGRGSISDTPDRSLCRRAPVSSPSPCSRRSRPEIISTVLPTVRFFTISPLASLSVPPFPPLYRSISLFLDADTLPEKLDVFADTRVGG